MSRLLSALCVIVVIVTGFGPGLTSAVARQAESTKIMRFNWGGIPDTLDPQSSHEGQWAISGLDFEGLTRVDEDMQIVPAAAQSWEFSEDRLTLTFHLRDGLVFSDGAPLTAEHFRYGAERMCDPYLHSRSASYLFPVVGCEELFDSLDGVATPTAAAAAAAARAKLGVTAPDDRTLMVRLKEPAPEMPAVAAVWPFVPLRQELVEQGGPDWWTDAATRVGKGAKIEAEWFFQMFHQVLGVDLNIEYVSEDEFDALFDDGQSTQPQLSGGAWFSDLPDPSEWFPGNWDCKGMHFAKRVGYCNPQLDALIRKAENETDPERRIAIYEDVGRMFVADCPAIFAHTASDVMLVKPYVIDYSRTAPNWQYPGWTNPMRVDLAPH